MHRGLIAPELYLYLQGFNLCYCGTIPGACKTSLKAVTPLEVTANFCDPFRVLPFIPGAV